jgi:DNA-directed RNA polymerase subunit RPC12/RpoP
MPTVTFKCGHCGRLIGIDAEYLGRQVRCGHCRGVVLAGLPQATGLTSAIPVASTDQATAVPAPIDPTLDFPPLALPAPEAEAPQPHSIEQQQQLAIAANEEPVVTLQPVAASEPGPPVVMEAQEQSLPAPPAAVETSDAPAPDEALVPPELPGRERRTPARAAAGVSIWFVIPLVSYSILATLLAVVLWNRLQAVEDHPLIAFLPDSEGDSPGVVRKPKGVNEARKRRLITDPLPDSLKVRLGQTRTVGALAVTPMRVSRERVAVGDGSGDPEKLKGPSLVLHLRLQNVSEDQTFQPLDRYFDRKWREGSSPAPPPLTLLEAGPGQRFYGGPAEWQPRTTSRRDNSARPEFVYLMESPKSAINPIDHPLGPGETTDVVVCTDGNDPRSARLVAADRTFLWRVHLRRGLVHVRGKDVPAAAVVGVVFSGRDVGDG